MFHSEIIQELKDIADSLVPVSGELMRRACGDDFEHPVECECSTCRAFVASQNATTRLEVIIRILQE